MGNSTHRRTGLWLSRGLDLAVLLLQLLNLLQGEEGAATAWRILGVHLCPLLEGLGVAAVHMEPQVLLVLGGEVTELTSKRLPSCRRWESSRGSLKDGRQALTTSCRAVDIRAAGRQAGSSSHPCA